ncbi:hypothetical protein BD770DRAFT_408247 [Pilaira anomala]|nr:hypothetical protein BD770DRAFT_408247 [Pilaira anomala]
MFEDTKNVVISENIENRKTVYSNEFTVCTTKTSVRKRKCDIPSSCYKTVSNDIACYPAYASENVHFGRWQSITTHKSKKPNVSLPSPSTSPNSPYLPPITSIQQQKWMMMDDNDHTICNRLPPLKEIKCYSPFQKCRFYDIWFVVTL